MSSEKDVTTNNSCKLNFLSEKEIAGYKKDFEEFDGDGNGTVSLEEFLKMMLRNDPEIYEEDYTQEELKEIAEERKADLKENAKLSLNEFLDKLRIQNQKEFNETLEEEIEELTEKFNRYDSDDNEEISLDEFLSVLEDIEVGNMFEDLDIDLDDYITEKEMIYMVTEAIKSKEDDEKRRAKLQQERAQKCRITKAVKDFIAEMDQERDGKIRDGKIDKREFVTCMRKQAEAECLEAIAESLKSASKTSSTPNVDTQEGDEPEGRTQYETTAEESDDATVESTESETDTPKSEGSETDTSKSEESGSDTSKSEESGSDTVKPAK